MPSHRSTCSPGRSPVSSRLVSRIMISAPTPSIPATAILPLEGWAIFRCWACTCRMLLPFMKKKGVPHLFTANEGDAREYDALYSFGARSFSVWNGISGALLFDSKNDLDQRILAAGRYDDGTSDGKSIGPEGLTIGKTHPRAYCSFLPKTAR